MIGHIEEATVDEPFDDVADRLADRIGELAARVLHGERLRTEDGRRIYQWVAVSRPLRASGFLPVFMHGARYSMFYVRLEDQGGSCAVKVATGGGETLTGFDFGRNRNIAQFLVDPGEGAGS